MEQNIIYDVNCIDYIRNMSKEKSIVLIYSPTTIEKCSLQEILDIEGVETMSSHVPFPSLLFECNKHYDVSIGIGGGAAIDRAKYIAYQQVIPCIAIPSILSTNVFATNKVAYIDKNNIKTTIDSILPETVIFDNGLISEVADKYSIYGLADAISILTALKDWEVADMDAEENIDKDFYIRAIRILDRAKRLILYSKHFFSIDIFQLLLQAGYITNDYGNGRPESGSEHILAKVVEGKIDVPHAVAVAFSMLIVSQFHHCFDEVADLISRLGIFEEVAQIPYDILRDSILEVKPRSDRYSIIDTLNEKALSVNQVQTYLNRMYERFDIHQNSVIFDLDGVLWDPVKEISRVYEKHLNRTNIDLRLHMGKTSRQIADELGISVEELQSIQSDEVSYLFNNPVNAYDSAIAVLKELKESGRNLFIVSNCQKGYINAFLETNGITSLFTDWCYDDGTSKADRLNKLREQHNLLYPVYVGDTDNDFISAEMTDMDFIAVDYGYGNISEKATLRISEISELPKLLEEKYDYTKR